MIRILADTRNAKQHWERRSDPVPYLMVPMSDGSVIRFDPQIRHPGYVKAIQNIRNMKTGYPMNREEDR